MKELFETAVLRRWGGLLLAGLAVLLLVPARAGAGCGAFYEHNNHGGSSQTFCGLVEYVGNAWNDKISSYTISSGSECVVCEHKNFAGKCMYLASGADVNAMPSGWNDLISSMNCQAAGFFSSNHVASGKGEAWIHAEYSGVALALDANTFITNLQSVSFNDCISSITTGYNLRCTFCKDRDFKGGCFTVGPHSQMHSLSKDWNDKISSIKCAP